MGAGDGDELRIRGAELYEVRRRFTPPERGVGIYSSSVSLSLSPSTSSSDKRAGGEIALRRLLRLKNDNSGTGALGTGQTEGGIMLVGVFDARVLWRAGRGEGLGLG